MNHGARLLRKIADATCCAILQPYVHSLAYQPHRRFSSSIRKPMSRSSWNIPCANKRPGWTTLHPDNWTVLEVAEWLNSVAEEYSLSYEVKVSLASAFSGVNGRQLMAMTLQNFTDLDPRHGGLLFTVFRHTVCAEWLGHLDEHPAHQARTLTPVLEVDSRRTGQHGEEDRGPLMDNAAAAERDRLSSDTASQGARRGPQGQQQGSPTHRYPQTSHSHQHQQPPSSGSSS